MVQAAAAAAARRVCAVGRLRAVPTVDTVATVMMELLAMRLAVNAAHHVVGVLVLLVLVLQVWIERWCREK